MSGEIRYELQLLTASLAVGLWLMVVYDMLRLFRMSVRHGNIWTNIEDICYWFCSGAVTFLLLFEQNDGVLRGYAIAGVMLGMVLYNLGVSRNTFKVLKKVKKYFTIRKTGNKGTDGRGQECVKVEGCEKRKKKI